jgi:hypothetical protein
MMSLSRTRVPARLTSILAVSPRRRFRRHVAFGGRVASVRAVKSHTRLWLFFFADRKPCILRFRRPAGSASRNFGNQVAEESFGISCISPRLMHQFLVPTPLHVRTRAGAAEATGQYAIACVLSVDLWPFFAT